jgi:MFS family permease
MATSNPRLLAVLLTHAVLTQAVTFVLRPTTSYRALELDISVSWLGALSASFAVVPLVLAVPSGHLVDRWGERVVMLAGAVILTAAGLAFVFFGTTVAGLLVANALLGTGHLCSVVGEQSLVANTTGHGRLDAAFGYYTFAASLGQSLGPGLIVLLGGDQPIPDTYRIFASTSLLAALLIPCSAMLGGTRHPDAVADPARHGSVAMLLRMPGLLRALTTSCVVLAAVDITLAYLPALGADRGLAAGVVGLLLALRAAASMTSRLFLGRLSRLLGRQRLLLGSVTASALGLALVPVPMPLWLLAVMIIVVGLALGVGQPLTMSWVAAAAPPGLRGRAMALRLTGNRVGQVVIPSSVGLIAAGLGAGGVLWATAAALAVAATIARRLPAESPTA